MPPQPGNNEFVRSYIDEALLRPLIHTTKGFYVFLGFLIFMLLQFGFSWYTQITQGLIVTGMRDIPGGSPFGIYLSTFIFWIGLAHGGVVISASVRLLKLIQYRVVARIAELATLFALPMAGLSIVFDLGRPDRLINLIRYGRWQSPMLWDLTAITTYFIATLIYLYLSMRRDIVLCMEKIPKRRWLYRLLAMGYGETKLEEEKHSRTLWWLALTIVPIMVTVSTVVSWIFGLLSGRPGWYSTIFGIYFVVGAILSGLAVVYTLTYLFRKLYFWHNYITDDVLRGLAWGLRNVFILYLYLWIQESLTVGYMGPTAERRVLSFLLSGPWAPVFWTMLLFTFILPGVTLFAPMFKGEWFKPRVVFISSILLNISLWVKRLWIVVPSLLNPMLYPTGTYFPTATEISIMLGSFWMFLLSYTIFTKLLPIIELEVAGR